MSHVSCKPTRNDFPPASPLILAAAVGLLTAAAFGVSVGVITGAIDTPIFERATPAYAIDYPIWALNALLVGALAG